MHSTFHDSIPFLFVQILIIVFAAPLAAKLAIRWGQPVAVGWIAAGVLLGPSVFGALAPDLFSMVFRPASAGLTTEAVGEALGLEISLISEIGLVLLLFQMGAQFEFSHLYPGKESVSRKTFVSTIAISIGGIVCPFGLSLVFSGTIYELAETNVSFLGFSLFIGIAMSITALPILALMMKEMGIAHTRIGVVTVTAGSIDDAVGWIKLAGITSIVTSSFVVLAFLTKFSLLTLIYAPAMLFVVRPYLCKWLTNVLDRNNGTLPRDEFAVLIGCVFLSGLVTQLLGIFAIFGAFLMGALIASVPGIRSELDKRLEWIVTSLFLPVFFTSTGLRTDIGGLNTVNGFLLLAIVLSIAITGKFVGCAVAARLTGFSTREACCIGIMMNCRALMELVAINVGRDLGLVPPQVFTALVIMALITTAMTKPLLVRFANGTELEPYIGTKRAIPDQMLATTSAIT